MDVSEKVNRDGRDLLRKKDCENPCGKPMERLRMAPEFAAKKSYPSDLCNHAQTGGTGVAISVLAVIVSDTPNNFEQTICKKQTKYQTAYRATN